MIARIRLLLAGVLLLGVVGMAGSTASAQFKLFGDPCEDNPQATVCLESEKTQTQQDNSLYGPNGVVGKIVSILALVIGVAAVIIIIVAGIQYMLSTGDPTKTNNAKNAILYALVGLALAVVARTIVVFVIGRL